LHTSMMKYHTEKCTECGGTGTITYEKPEPWVCRDSPPSIEEIVEECDECGGTAYFINITAVKERLTK